MTREEFEKIKQAEKEHLRALKKLKQKVRSLEQKKAVSGALGDLASSTGSLLDEHTALVEKLSQETAMQEARFEVAMESIDSSSKPTAEAQRAQDEADLAALEAERQKSRARDLVRQVKLQMGSPDAGTEEAQADDTSDSADRTIGRKRAGAPDDTADDAAADDAAPEKTIGRMRRT